MNDRRKDELEEGFRRLEEDTPDWLSRTLRWLRDPEKRYIRLPVGIFFILGSFLWFLPVLGIEMLPIGFLLIAQDVPFLQKPAGRFLIWTEDKWRALRKRWRMRGR